MLRKVMRFTCEDSPNVKLARLQLARGQEPTNEIIVPGVLSWQDLQDHLRTWDKHRQSVGLYAEFYEGVEVRLFPAEYLIRSKEKARQLAGIKRIAKSIGCDPGEGEANTAWAAGDELGLIELMVLKTPDTSVIRGRSLEFMRRHNVPPNMFLFDRGGGGLQIADDLRADGYPVRSVGFGEGIVLEPKRGMRLFPEKKEVYEEKGAFFNRRAQMYADLATLTDPMRGNKDWKRIEDSPGWAIPEEYGELLRQMALIPKRYDKKEGQLRIPPKNKRDKDDDQETLEQIIGHSPDELDAVVLMVHAMLHPQRQSVAGAIS